MFKIIHSFFMVLFFLTASLGAEPSLALQKSIEKASTVEKLLLKKDLSEQTKLLLAQREVQITIQKQPIVEKFFTTASSDEQRIIALMIALGQETVLFDGIETLKDPEASLHHLAKQLLDIDQFYESIGGLVGYHQTNQKLLFSGAEKDNRSFFPPPVQNIQELNPTVWNSCYWGTVHLDSTATILPLGGAGDRLNLIDEATGEPLPAACLPFCGKTLFEGLMRDIEAQEYWHYRVCGDQVTMPVLIMTSQEKHNDQHIEAMCQSSHWFGRSPSSIRRIVQPLVPVIDTDGQWIFSSPLELALKPGGHGVIWKLAEQTGSLQWLSHNGIDSAVVRQVNNPLAGLDINLLSLVGYGQANNKSFGFLSCPSRPGLAEGMNVLAVEKSDSSAKATITNIEYTQFAAYKALQPQLFSQCALPANINVLFIRLQDIPPALERVPIPGMIVNPKTVVDVVRQGQTTKKTGGRLESCMQNIAEGLSSPIDENKLPNISEKDLATFLILQQRGRVMSATKKAYVPGQSIAETPVGCLYDWHLAMQDLLTNSCHMQLPEASSAEEFVTNGPSFVFTYHPALGPIWDVIGQKISKGSLAKGSELDTEIAELSCTNLSLDGSLRIHANRVTGLPSVKGETQFSPKVGRARLHSVTIHNAGLCHRDPTALLKGALSRKETCEIILEGFSELEASNITINGPFHLVVPDGKKATLTQDSSSKITVTLTPITEPSWHYDIDWKNGCPPRLIVQD